MTTVYSFQGPAKVDSFTDLCARTSFTKDFLAIVLILLHLTGIPIYRGGSREK